VFSILLLAGNLGSSAAQDENGFGGGLEALGEEAPEVNVSESEPNDTAAAADPVIFGDRFTGSISTPTDVDFIAFPAVAGDHIIAQLLPGGGLSDSVLSVIGTNGTTVLKTDDNADTNTLLSQLSYVFAASGTFYIRIDNKTTEIGSYTLSLQRATNGEHDLESEPNDQPTSPDPMTVGRAMRAEITPGPDFDFFSFNAPTGSRMYAYMQTDGSTAGNDTSGEDGQIAILNPAGNFVESDDDAGAGLAPLITGAVATSTGAHLLRVNEMNQTSDVRPYVIHTAVYTASTNESEPNNTFGSADPGVGLNAGSIGSAGDVDFYSFAAVPGDSVFIALDNDPDQDPAVDPLDSRITLLNTDGVTPLLVSNYSPNGNDGDEVLVFTPRLAGTYYVMVEDANGNGGSGYTYHLGIRITAGIAPTTIETIGLYVPATAVVFMKHANSSGPADITFTFGAAGAGLQAIAGDWNADTLDSIGVYNPATAAFFFKNVNANGPADVTAVFGPVNPAFLPVSGDWNNDGLDTMGIYDPATSTFFLRNSLTPGPADITVVFGAGGAGLKPVVGDWNGDGIDTIGVYDPATGSFFLRNSFLPGPADIVFTFGGAGAGLMPIAGDWNGDGVDTIGLYDPASGAFFLRNSNTPGPADITFVFGGGGAQPIAGDWSGN
jgi:ribosomal protein S16